MGNCSCTESRYIPLRLVASISAVAFYLFPRTRGDDTRLRARFASVYIWSWGTSGVTK